MRPDAAFMLNAAFSTPDTVGRMANLLAAAPDSADAATSAVGWVPAMLLVLGVVAIGVILIFSTRGRIARRNASRDDERERIINLRSAPRPRDDVDAATAHLLTTVQDLTARLNTHAARLETLIEQADERIERLTQATHGAPASDRAGDDGQRGAPEPAPPPPLPKPTLDPLTRSVYDLADAGHDAVSIARQLDEQIGKIQLILALRTSST